MLDISRREHIVREKYKRSDVWWMERDSEKIRKNK